VRLFGPRPVLGVLFVCMGNICRSPTAEGVFRHRAKLAGIDRILRIDSAGTHAHHQNEPPDARSIQAAARRDYNLRKIRARQVVPRDFMVFDYILAMDQYNMRSLESLKPEESRAHVGLFLDFAPQVGQREVPDPYYGGPDGFEHVLDLAEAGATGLMEAIRVRLLEQRGESGN